MRVIPVLDLLGGEVVRAIGGRRDAYRPIRSPLTSSSRPVDVARAFVREFACDVFYVADIDALQGRPANETSVREIVDLDARVWLDVGLTDPPSLERLRRAMGTAWPRVSPILASESLAGPAALARLVDASDGGELAEAIFSLDLRDGRPLSSAAWNDAVPEQIFLAARAVGLRRFIVLDLARVGGDGGVGTLELCRRLAALAPEAEIFAGGGVRGGDDLARLHAAGCRGALVATALHDGRLTPADLQAANAWRGQELQRGL